MGNISRPRHGWLGFRLARKGSGRYHLRHSKEFRWPHYGECRPYQGSGGRLNPIRYGDLCAFGRLYMSNPDLPERFANNWPTETEAAYEHWWGSTGAKGYTDFAFYKEEEEKKDEEKKE